MIIDTIQNLSLYGELNPFLPAVCEFLATTDIDSLAEGWHAVVGDGEDAYAMVATEVCRNEDDADLEAHRKYIDVQICLNGYDRIGWRPLADCHQPINEYEPEDDLVFFSDPPQDWLNLSPGLFVMLLPSDAHKPLVGKGEVRKLVLKMRCE